MSTVLRFTDDELRAEIKRLLRQLPEGMKHCTIVFRECALGHGWLTATNWAPFECPTCAIQAERARAEKAEAELDAVMHTIDKWFLEGVPDTNPATRAAEAREIALMAIDEERVRRQKAEAERDEFKQVHRHALDSVDQVFQACDEVPHPLLPDFCRVGEDKFRAVIRLANSYISERARAEKYLKAITEWIEIEDIDRQPRTHKDKTDDEYSAFLARMESRRISAVLAIRAIVEEARRAE